MASAVKTLTLTTGIEDECPFLKKRCSICVSRACFPDMMNKEEILEMICEIWEE